MTVLSFVYSESKFSENAMRRSFLARRGRVPLRTQVEIETIDSRRKILRLEADWDGSVTAHVPYFHSRYGLFYFSTETLAPRNEPFYLVRELARGQLSRILKKYSEWQIIGLRVPASFRFCLKNGITKMSRLATLDYSDFSRDSEAVGVFEELIDISHLLLDQFIEQSLAARRASISSFPIFSGICVRDSRLEIVKKKIEKTNFQTLNADFCWKDLEPDDGRFCWDDLDAAMKTAEKKRWSFVPGPLVRWEKRYLPRWILDYLDDPSLLEYYLFRFWNAVLERYSFAPYWIVSSGNATRLGNVSIATRIEWNEVIAQKIYETNQEAKILIGIKQPWGDSSWINSGITPIEIGRLFIKNPMINGFFLEIDFGLSSCATLPRDAFEFSSLLDFWGSLGKKLYISFSVPSDFSLEFDDALKNSSSLNLVWNQKIQQEQVRRYFLALLIRKSIAGVYWSRLLDSTTDFSDENSFFYSGLFTNDGKAKSGYYKLTSLIRAYLN